MTAFGVCALVSMIEASGEKVESHEEASASPNVPYVE